jgi:cobalt-zinc-cadmium efflux system outer membrane protein
MVASMVALGALTGLGGCSSVNYRLTDPSPVSANIAARFGQSLGPTACPRQIYYPYGISLETELTEELAVLIALWNNALFLETLADLGIAQGDLVQAGLLPNPEFVYWFPMSEKPFKYLVDFPLEALWLRPIRVAAAGREVDRVRSRLTQVGIDLIRDTRVGFADVLLAHGRREVAHQALAIRQQIATLAQERFDAGDISRQELSAARIEADIAAQDAARIDFDVGIAEERLRNLMGVSNDRTPLRVLLLTPPYPPAPPVAPLVAEATNSRPDALAAIQNANAAAERLRLARIGWVRFLGIADATSGLDSHRLGPAFRVTVPLWNWNQGNIARAEADLEKAERQRQTVNNQIVQDVYQSQLRFAQAQAEIAILNTKVRPEADTALRRTEAAYRDGNTSYVVVLQTTQQWIFSRLREFELQAGLRRTWAELERSVGRHLEDIPLSGPEPLPPPIELPAAPHDAPPGQPPNPK